MQTNKNRKLARTTRKQRDSFSRWVMYCPRAPTHNSSSSLRRVACRHPRPFLSTRSRDGMYVEFSNRSNERGVPLGPVGKRYSFPFILRDAKESLKELSWEVATASSISRIRRRCFIVEETHNGSVHSDCVLDFSIESNDSVGGICRYCNLKAECESLQLFFRNQNHQHDRSSSTAGILVGTGQGDTPPLDACWWGTRGLKSSGVRRVDRSNIAAALCQC